MNAKDDHNVTLAVTQLREAAAAKKCWSCGCMKSAVAAIEESCRGRPVPSDLDAALQSARERIGDIRYDCLGCEVCYPAIAINALHVESDPCPSEPVRERNGWPPLPGTYSVLRYNAPVAVCTLTGDDLSAAIAREAGPDVAIAGTLYTENLGIERLILNVLGNPHIRFLVVCGPDSRQAIGHLPGQSLIALAHFGMDERARIIGALGKRPRLRNISPEAVEHFRRTVEVVDKVGCNDLSSILEVARECSARNPGPAEPFHASLGVVTIPGHLPERMIPDPAGYFVVHPDVPRRTLVLEHYTNDGLLDTLIEGRQAAEVYTPAVERGLISRLDHAAYLGKELARAERALHTNESYIQDAAPAAMGPPDRQDDPSESPKNCGCSAPCAGSK